jgi:hypothetical protein
MNSVAGMNQDSSLCGMKNQTSKRPQSKENACKLETYCASTITSTPDASLLL